LIYSGQSGGINESFSDIAGEAAEMFMHGSNDFEVGADIFKAQDEALRYMDDPPRDGNSIGHTDDYYSGMDVHYSSGIFNKAFHLLVTTKGWTVQEAFTLFATANQMHWDLGSGFDDAFDGLILAAGDDPESKAVKDVTAVFFEVGVPVPPPAPACDGIGTEALANGVSSNKVNAVTGDWKCWTLDVGADALTLDVVVRDTSKRRQNGGDADLYIRFDSSPVVDMSEGTPTGDFDCGSYSSNSNERCDIESPAAGTWYFAVYAWSAYPSVTVTGTYTLDTGEPPPPTGDITATASEKGGGRFVQVRWEGASSSTVDIKRNGGTIADGTANDGSHKDNGGGTGDVYQVCEANSDVCSAEVTAN
jgi:vibriolysin